MRPQRLVFHEGVRKASACGIRHRDAGTNTQDVCNFIGGFRKIVGRVRRKRTIAYWGLVPSASPRLALVLAFIRFEVTTLMATGILPKFLIPKP